MAETAPNPGDASRTVPLITPVPILNGANLQDAVVPGPHHSPSNTSTEPNGRNLPAELLIHIIMDFLNEFWYDETYDHPGGPTYQMALTVLRRQVHPWFTAAIDDNPLLWATVDIADPLATTMLAVMKSQSIPLRVEARQRRYRHPQGVLSSSSEEFFGLLMTTRSPVKIILVDHRYPVHHSYSQLFKFLLQPHPTLELMDFKFKTLPHLSRQMYSRLSNATKSLKCLRMEAEVNAKIFLELSSVSLRGLEELIISGNNFNPNPDSATLLQIPRLVNAISVIERLRVFKIHAYYCQTMTEAQLASNPPQPLELTHLEDFAITASPNRVARELLGAIRLTPACTNFKVHGSNKRAGVPAGERLTDVALIRLLETLDDLFFTEEELQITLVRDPPSFSLGQYVISISDSEASHPDDAVLALQAVFRKLPFEIRYRVGCIVLSNDLLERTAAFLSVAADSFSELEKVCTLEWEDSWRILNLAKFISNPTAPEHRAVIRQWMPQHPHNATILERLRLIEIRDDRDDKEEDVELVRRIRQVLLSNRNGLKGVRIRVNETIEGDGQAVEVA